MTPGEVVAVVLVPLEANYRWLSFDAAARALWQQALAGTPLVEGQSVVRSIIMDESNANDINLATWRKHRAAWRNRERRDAEYAETRERLDRELADPRPDPETGEVGAGRYDWRAVLNLAREHWSTGHPRAVDNCPVCSPAPAPRYDGDRAPCPGCGRPDDVWPFDEKIGGGRRRYAWRCSPCRLIFEGTADEWHTPAMTRRRREAGYVGRRDVDHRGRDERYDPRDETF